MLSLETRDANYFYYWLPTTPCHFFMYLKRTWLLHPLRKVSKFNWILDIARISNWLQSINWKIIFIIRQIHTSIYRLIIHRQQQRREGGGGGGSEAKQQDIIGVGTCIMLAAWCMGMGMANKFVRHIGSYNHQMWVRTFSRDFDKLLICHKTLGSPRWVCIGEINYCWCFRNVIRIVQSTGMATYLDGLDIEFSFFIHK